MLMWTSKAHNAKTRNGNNRASNIKTKTENNKINDKQKIEIIEY